MWFQVKKKINSRYTMLCLVLLICLAFWASIGFLKLILSNEQKAGGVDLVVYTFQSNEYIYLLPLVMSILCHGDTWSEIQNRFFLFSVSRIGKRRYILHQMMIPLITGGVCFFLSQFLFAGFIVSILMVENRFNGLLQLLTFYECISFFLRIVVYLCFCIFLSGAFSLLMKSIYASLVGPFVLCYVMIVFQQRYYPNMTWLSPERWISGGIVNSVGLIFATLFAFSGYIFLLRWRIKNV